MSVVNEIESIAALIDKRYSRYTVLLDRYISNMSADTLVELNDIHSDIMSLVVKAKGLMTQLNKNNSVIKLSRSIEKKEYKINKLKKDLDNIDGKLESSSLIKVANQKTYLILASLAAIAIFLTIRILYFGSGLTLILLVIFFTLSLIYYISKI